MLAKLLKPSIEKDLAQYKDLSEQIKILEAQKDNIKNALIASYFSEHEEYKDQYGIVRATYKAQIRAMFDTTRFKTEQPKVYKDYCNDKEFYTFLVK